MTPPTQHSPSSTVVSFMIHPFHYPSLYLYPSIILPSINLLLILLHL
jgi:hypothetical protein